MSAEETVLVRVRALKWADLVLLSDVLRKVGHDLNNAMVPALGLSDIMRTRHKQTNAASDIERLHGRLEKLRDASSMAVAHTLRGSDGMARHMSRVMRQMKGEASASGVQLRWQVADEPEPWPLPCLDANCSRLLLHALVLNALQAHGREQLTSDGQEAGIHVQFHEAEGGSHPTLLTVQDNGPGCLDLHGAAQGTASRNTRSRLGLGLVVASSLVARGGGHLEIGCPAQGGFVAVASWPATTTDAS